VELPGKNLKMDVVAIRPIVRELKRRLKHGVPPIGILRHLMDGQFHTTEDLARKAGMDAEVISKILSQKTDSGWIERINKNGRTLWRIKDYRVPAKEVIFVCCDYRNLNKMVQKLQQCTTCCNKLYAAFPYDIDKETTEALGRMGIGVLVINHKTGAVREVQPLFPRNSKDINIVMTVCEIVIAENIRQMAPALLV